MLKNKTDNSKEEKNDSDETEQEDKKETLKEINKSAIKNRQEGLNDYQNLDNYDYYPGKSW